jgi:hypothetical protein
MPATAEALFAQMRREAPPRAECEPFAAALRNAVAQLDSPWPAPLHAVLALEEAFETLARSIEKEP